MYGFLLGLTGSWHCAVMCGPLQSFFFNSSQKNYWAFITYQIGRISVYAILGYFVAYLGVLGLFAKFWYVYFVLVAIFIALLLLGIIKDQSFTFLHNFFGKPLQEFGKKLGNFRFLLFGMSNGFLPCGLVMGGLGISLIQNSPILGAWNMVIFGISTLPALILTHLGFQKSLLSSQSKIGKVLQWISWIVVLGLLFQGFWGILAQVSDAVKNHPLTPIICH